MSFEPTIAPTKADSSTYNVEPALRRRGRGGERRDPDYCFNHQDRPRAGACDDCGEPFCGDCLIKFQGVTLCGPCKNFRVRGMELPPATSSLATASVAISLLTGVPLVFCLLPFGQSVLSLLALLPQLVALGLGGRAALPGGEGGQVRQPGVGRHRRRRRGPDGDPDDPAERLRQPAGVSGLLPLALRERGRG